MTITNAVFLVPVEFLSRWTHTLVAALGVYAAILTAPAVDAAFIYVSTVSEAVQDVSLVAQALKAARVIDAGVVTGSLKGALINVLACSFISEQLVTFLTAAFEGAHCVPAEVITASVVFLAFIYVFAGFAIWLQGESHRAAAAHPCGCVFTRSVAATIVHSTGFDAGLAV